MLKHVTLIFLIVITVADAAAFFEKEKQHVEWFQDPDFQNEADVMPDEDPTEIPEGTLDIEGNVFDASRVKAILVVHNGGKWGDWSHQIDFCPQETWAAGYDMKIEPKKRTDNTALNGIRLICKDKEGAIKGEITCGVGPWGEWVGSTFCKVDNETSDYLTAFNLQVQKPMGWRKDDTAANYVRFDCRGLNESNAHAYVIDKPPGHGMWGEWGDWSKACPERSAICGMKTKVEKKQHLGDDTALNSVIFYCCE